MAVFYDFLRALNQFIEENKLETEKNESAIQALVAGTTVFKELTSTLGLFRIPVAEESEQNDALVEPLMNLLIDLRRNAKKNKDFATADEIRNRLKDLGITLEDRPGGVCVWSKDTK